MSRFSLGLGVTLVFACAVHAKSQEPEDKLVSVKARDLQLEVPESWKQVKSDSTMRVAEFAIPPSEDNGEGAEMVVYYFGNATGGTKANVERWIGQFYEDGRKHEITGGKCREGEFVLVSVSGTYKKPEGPPAAGKTVDKPGSRVVGVVLVTEMDAAKEYYFLKLSGPEALVAAEAAALRTAIGVDKESEKPVELDDLGE